MIRNQVNGLIQQKAHKPSELGELLRATPPSESTRKDQLSKEKKKEKVFKTSPHQDQPMKQLNKMQSLKESDGTNLQANKDFQIFENVSVGLSSNSHQKKNPQVA